MSTQDTESEVMERFAEMEHQRWARWQEYVHDRCTENDDGSLTIPAQYVAHWKAQIATPYAHLAEAEKESDRKEVRPYLEYARAYGDERERRGWRKCALKVEDIAAEFGDDAPPIIGEYIGEGLHNTRTTQAEDTNK